MQTLPYYQVDAFADRLFAGNPAGVCPLPSWLPDAVLQAIAAENNLSETAFLVPDGDDFQLRWFTPVAEVDLCGHATLATAHVLWREMGRQPTPITFHTRSGRLAVKQSEALYWLDFPTDKLEPAALPAALEKAIAAEITASFQGREDYLIVLKQEEAVAELKPAPEQMARAGGRGVIVTAPGKSVDFVSRCFFPNVGIAEDPVTGSAHTTLTPYWAEQLQKTEMTARQISKRGGTVHCRLQGERVELGGKAVTYLRGEIVVEGA